MKLIKGNNGHVHLLTASPNQDLWDICLAYFPKRNQPNPLCCKPNPSLLFGATSMSHLCLICITFPKLCMSLWSTLDEYFSKC